MIIDLTIKQDLKTQKILDELAPYDPPQNVKDRISQVMRDFSIANNLKNKPYTEFNNISLIDRMNLDQMSFNQYTEAISSDPAEAWRSRAFRPIVRNKIISIAAHITASIIEPKVYAQNNQDQEDRDAAVVMRDLMEWSNEQSGYEKNFIKAVLSALVNPASCVYTEYAERFRKIKEIQEDGTWVEREVPDELYSGFQDTIVPLDELWIGNPYEPDIQKQPYIIWRRVIDYGQAKEKHGQYENFKKYVKPGIQFLYSDQRNLFYQQYDLSLQGRLVEEIIYFNYTGDLQLVFVNGVLLTDPDQPNPRKDKKYPFVWSGYEYIDTQFAYFKSLAFKLANDEEVVNTAYRMVIDGTYLQIMPPAVVFGQEEIGTSVIMPGMVTTIDNSNNPNASFQTIATNNNLTAGYNLLSKVEGSISESSSDPLMGGQIPGGTQTAFEISRVEQQARTILGLFGKMVSQMVKDWGTLRMSDIVQFMTVGEVSDVIAADTMLKFRQFLLPDKNIEGKTRTRKIEFDMELPDEGTPEELMEMSQKLVDTEEQMNDEMRIYKVNPTLFRNLKFKVVVSPEAILPKSDAVQKALMLEEYGMAIANPLIDQASVTRDLLLGAFDKTKNDPDKYMKQAINEMGAGQLGLAGQPPQSPQSLSDSGLANALTKQTGGTSELLQATL